MLRVYIETTIPSYLTSRRSRDLVIAARQEMTQEWWEDKRQNVELFSSELVLQEAQGGNKEAAKKRLISLENIPLLDITEGATLLAKALVHEGLIPEKASEDALHIAIATVHDIDILLTWNCTHLANVTVLRKMLAFIRSQGYEPPVICTPDEMMGDDYHA